MTAAAQPPRVIDEAVITPIARDELALKSRFAPAGTATEAALQSIWGDELAVTGIGIDDDFFALGGDSFSAAAIFAAVADSFGADLSISILARAATIRSLAAEIDAWRESHRASTLITVRAAGDAAPIVFLHGTGGEIHFLRKLREHLDPGRPLHGLRGRGLAPGERAFTSVAKIVDDHLATLRVGAINGRIVLIGSCDGAVVAYEMARRLAAEGRTPEALILIDPLADALTAPWLVPTGVWPRHAARIRLRIRLLRRLIHGRFARPKPHHVSRDFIEGLQLALNRHVPGSYAGPLLLICARDQASLSLGPRGWRRLVTGPFDHAVVAADHGALVNGTPPPFAPIATRYLERLRQG